MAEKLLASRSKGNKLIALGSPSMAFLERGCIFYRFLAEGYGAGYRERAMPAGAPLLVYTGFPPVCAGVVPCGAGGWRGILSLQGTGRSGALGVREDKLLWNFF